MITITHNSVLLSETRCIFSIVFRICQNPLCSVKTIQYSFHSSFICLGVESNFGLVPFVLLFQSCVFWNMEQSLSELLSVQYNPDCSSDGFQIEAKNKVQQLKILLCVVCTVRRRGGSICSRVAISTVAAPCRSLRGCSQWMGSLSVFCQYLYGSKGCVISKWWWLRAVGWGWGGGSVKHWPKPCNIHDGDSCPMLLAVIWVDGGRNAMMEGYGWKAKKKRKSFRDLFFKHSLFIVMHSAMEALTPTSTGLFSHCDTSGLREEAPA